MCTVVNVQVPSIYGTHVISRNLSIWCVCTVYIKLTPQLQCAVLDHACCIQCDFYQYFFKQSKIYSLWLSVEWL